MNTENLNTEMSLEDEALASIAACALEDEIDIEDELLAMMGDETPEADVALKPFDEEPAFDVGRSKELDGFEDAEKDKSKKAPSKSSAKKKAKPAESEVKPAKRTVNRTSTAGMSCSDALHHKLGESLYETCILTTEMAALNEADLKKQIDAVVNGFNTLPKKVREKVLNVFQHVHGGVNLSTYTAMAMTLLKLKGEITSDDLRQAYIDRPYSTGTASAQSSQMFQLLPALGLANRDGKALTLNPNSVLKEML